MHATPDSRERAKPRVLSIGTDAPAQRFVAESLGGDYELAAEGEALPALEKVRAARPDLIIARVATFALHRDRLFAAIRNDGDLAQVPILLLSASGEEERQIELLDAGAADFVTEPSTATELRVRVRKLIESKRSGEYRHILFDAMDRGFCIVEVLFDAEDRPFDCRVLEANLSFAKRHGISDARGKRLRALAVDYEQYWFDILGEVAMTGESARFENGAATADGKREVHAFRVGQKEKRQVAIFFNDSTARKRSREALRDTEQELRALADSIPQLAWMAEPDGNIFWYNSRWYAYTGLTLDEMQGWGWKKVQHPEHVERVVVRWTAALASGEPWEDTFPLRGHDGRYRWFLSRAYPIRDAQGTVLRWFGTNTDVDEVKRTQDALRDESRILERLNQTGAAIAAELDLETLVQTVTDAATELSGAQFGAFFYNVTDDKGGSLVLYTLSGAPRAAFEKFGLPRNTPIFQRTFKGERIVRFDDITQAADYGAMAPHHGLPAGHLPVRSYLAASVLSRSGDVLGALFFGHADAGVFNERTERLLLGVAAQAAIAIDNAQLYDAQKKAQAALSRAHEDLELRVAERTASLSEAVAQMEEFSYTVSHDLRAPLRAMQAYSEALLEDCSDALADRPQSLEHLKRIASNAARLDKMALDVLTFSRVTRGELRLEVVSADRLAREIMEYSTAMQAPNAQIQIEPLPDIIGHEPSLTQVLSNLLSNAVKFVAPGTIPQVHVWSERRGSDVRIWIQDNGVGVDPQYQHRLFRMFERIHPDAPYHGTGVGLAVVRKAAERMNGTVGMESDGVNGSRFWVQLLAA